MSLNILICDFLATNPVLLDGKRADEIIHMSTGQALEPYVTHMRKKSTWGGAIEIRAYTILAKANVRVRVLKTRKNIDFVHDPSNPLSTITWDGGHYEPLLNGALKKLPTPQ